MSCHQCPGPGSPGQCDGRCAAAETCRHSGSRWGHSIVYSVIDTSRFKHGSITVNKQKIFVLFALICSPIQLNCNNFQMKSSILLQIRGTGFNTQHKIRLKFHSINYAFPSSCPLSLVLSKYLSQTLEPDQHQL